MLDAPPSPDPSPDDTQSDITLLLQRWSEGDAQALDAVIPRVYAELRQSAVAQLRRLPSSTLQPTELIHEAFFKIRKDDQVQWQNREQFFAVAATQMRRVLVDLARRRIAAKRGGEDADLTLDGREFETPSQPLEVLDIHRALDRLAEKDRFKASVVELKFFGGLTLDECAKALGCGVDKISRNWRMARAWLLRELDHGRSTAGRDEA